LWFSCQGRTIIYLSNERKTKNKEIILARLAMSQIKISSTFLKMDPLPVPINSPACYPIVDGYNSVKIKQQ
jgi:hypothetical protein